MPAGTYFVRAERDYDNGVNQSFAVNNLSVNTVSGSSATFANDAGYTSAAATDAVNAANTYIDNYREGADEPDDSGRCAGHAGRDQGDQFGVQVGHECAGQLSIRSSVRRGSAPYADQDLLQNFNSITPENAGKWAESETTSQLNNLDSLSNFAQQNNLRVRMHNRGLGKLSNPRM